MYVKDFGHLCLVRHEGYDFVVNSLTQKLVNPMNLFYRKVHVNPFIVGKKERDKICFELEANLGNTDHFKTAKVIRLPEFQLPGVTPDNCFSCRICLDYVTILENKMKHHIFRNHKDSMYASVKGKTYIISLLKGFKTYFLIQKKPDPFVKDVMVTTPPELIDEYLTGIGNFEKYLDGRQSYLYPVDGVEYSKFRLDLKEYFLKKRDHTSRTSKYGDHFVANDIMVTAKGPTLETYASGALEFLYIMIQLHGGGDVDDFLTYSLPDYLLRSDTVGFVKEALYRSFIKGKTPRKGSSRAVIFDGVKTLMKFALMDHFLVNDIIVKPAILNQTTFDMIMREYALHLGYQRSVPSTSIKELEDGHISIDNTCFSIPMIRALIKNLCEEYEMKLRVILDDPFFLDIDHQYTLARSHLTESPATTEGAFFAFASAEFSVKAEVIFDRLKDEFDWENRVTDKIRSSIKTKLKKMHELNLIIFVAIVFSCGSPYRVSELLTLRFRNTPDSRRNVLFMNETLLEITHNKNNHRNKRYNVFRKSIPECVNKILIHYLSLVRRLEYGLAAEVAGPFLSDQERERAPDIPEVNIFVGDSDSLTPVATDNESSDEESNPLESSDEDSNPLDNSAENSMVTQDTSLGSIPGMVDLDSGEESDVFEDALEEVLVDGDTQENTEGDEMIDLEDQLNREFAKQGNQYQYALQYFVFVGFGSRRKGPQILRYMNKITRKLFNVGYTPRLTRQALVYFTRKYVSEFFGNFRPLILTDLVAGHSIETASRNYGVNETFGRNTAIEDLQLEVSHSWHRCLELRPRDVAVYSRKKNLDFLEEIMVSKVRFSPTIMEEMGKILHKDKYRRYDQDKTIALLTVYLQTMNLFFVAPTGSGKTDLILVPPMIESSKKLPLITVLVVPFVSLKDDMYHRIKHKLKTKVYDPRESLAEYLNTEIIILQPEHAQSFRRLMGFLNRELSPRRIRRVVFDECHILLYHQDFRSGMSALIDMFGDQYPKVFLTATLPKQCEQELITQFGIQTNDFAIRCPTVRKNIKYHVDICHDPWEKALEIYERIKDEGKCLVYTYGKQSEDIVRFCDTVGCSFFHGGLTTTCKALRYKEFKEDKDVMVCTSAFAHGVDIGNISSVIVVGYNPEIIDFVQVVGRTYRGEPEKVAHVFLVDSSVKGHCVKYDECINRQISKEMDGRTLDCFQLRAESCDVCASKNSLVVTTERMKKRNRSRIDEVEGLDGLLGKLLTMFDAQHYGIQLHELKCSGCGMDEDEKTICTAEYHIGDECSLRTHLGILVIDSLRTGNDKFIEELEEGCSVLDIMEKLYQSPEVVQSVLEPMKTPEVPRAFHPFESHRDNFYQLVKLEFVGAYKRMEERQTREHADIGYQSKQTLEQIIVIWKEVAAEKPWICSECSMQTHQLCNTVTRESSFQEFHGAFCGPRNAPIL